MSLLGINYDVNIQEKGDIVHISKRQQSNDKEVSLDHTHIVTVSFSSIRYAMD